MAYAHHIEVVKQMDPHTKHTYLRNDYYEPTQAWPEYLDRISEWESATSRKFSQIRRDFVFKVLVLRSATMQCSDHQHTFSVHSRASDTNHVHMQTRDSFINESSCWYQTLLQIEEKLAKTSAAYLSARLSTNEAFQLQRAAGLDLVKSITGQTPQHIAKIKSQLQEFQLEEERHLTAPIVEQNVRIHRWFYTGDMDPIFPTYMILADHGFHNLIRSRPDRGQILYRMNKIRKLAKSKDRPILKTDVISAINKCDVCSTMPPPTPSYPGIYYAPPGNGKSTAQERGVFIGMDTDWLIKNASYDTTFLPFVKMGIPIITNQYTVPTQSGQKLIGFFNPEFVRLGPNNQPWTTTKEMSLAIDFLRSDLIILFDQGYLSDHLVELYYLQYVYDSIRVFQELMEEPRLLNNDSSMLETWMTT